MVTLLSWSINEKAFSQYKQWRKNVQPLVSEQKQIANRIQSTENHSTYPGILLTENKSLQLNPPCSETWLCGCQRPAAIVPKQCTFFSANSRCQRPAANVQEWFCPYKPTAASNEPAEVQRRKFRKKNFSFKQRVQWRPPSWIIGWLIGCFWCTDRCTIPYKRFTKLKVPFRTSFATFKYFTWISRPW